MRSKIDRRIRKTKQSLIDAYVELMDKYSEEEITVSMIAQYADVNRATFYGHYSNKDEFLEEMLCEVLENFRTAIILPMETEDRIKVSKLPSTTVHIFNYIEKNSEVFYALYTSHSKFKNRMQELFYSIFSKDITLNLQPVDTDIDYEMFLHYQSNATLGLIFHWIENRFKHSAEFMMTQLTAFSNTKVIDLKKV